MTKDFVSLLEYSSTETVLRALYNCYYAARSIMEIVRCHTWKMSSVTRVYRVFKKSDLWIGSLRNETINNSLDIICNIYYLVNHIRMCRDGTNALLFNSLLLHWHGKQWYKRTSKIDWAKIEILLYIPRKDSF